MIHVGLDMHKKYSRLIWMNDVGHILGRQTLYHDDKAALQDFFRSLPKPATVAMEATRSWYWLHDLMQEEGLQVKLAHPLKTNLIGDGSFVLLGLFSLNITKAIEIYVIAINRAHLHRAHIANIIQVSKGLVKNLFLVSFHFFQQT
jgi:GTPase